MNIITVVLIRLKLLNQMEITMMPILIQVRVKYSVTPYVNDSSYTNHYIAEDQWRNLKRIDMMENRTHEDTPLLVNIKGK